MSSKCKLGSTPFMHCFGFLPSPTTMALSLLMCHCPFAFSILAGSQLGSGEGYRAYCSGEPQLWSWWAVLEPELGTFTSFHRQCTGKGGRSTQGLFFKLSACRRKRKHSRSGAGTFLFISRPWLAFMSLVGFQAALWSRKHYGRSQVWGSPTTSLPQRRNFCISRNVVKGTKCYLLQNFILEQSQSAYARGTSKALKSRSSLDGVVWCSSSGVSALCWRMLGQKISRGPFQSHPLSDSPFSAINRSRRMEMVSWLQEERAWL